MEKNLTRIEDKIDKIVDRIGSIDVTLAAQHESLKDHMRRTELLENTVGPIQSKIDMLKGVLKMIALIALISGVGESIIITLDYIRKMK